MSSNHRTINWVYISQCITLNSAEPMISLYEFRKKNIISKVIRKLLSNAFLFFSYKIFMEVSDFLFCSIKYLLKEAAGKTIMNFSIFQISINFFKVGMNPWIIGCRRRQNHLCFGAVEARNWQGSRKAERERGLKLTERPLKSSTFPNWPRCHKNFAHIHR